MSSSHLGCSACRIRVRANAPEIGLLEGCCPICGASLNHATSSSDVLGFRSFDLDALSEHGSSDPRPRRPAPTSSLDEGLRLRTTRRWSDEGGSVIREAVVERPVMQ
jgi:hypothetical protein